jgi:recombination protein RecA
MPTAKAKAVLAKMQKEFGEDKVMMASEIPVGPPVSTGSIALDYATGYGGFPSNRTVEIHGKESTGKTTLALMTMANALKDNPGKMGLFMDVEHKVTKDWLIDLVGEDFANHRIFYVQPTSIENATNVYRAALQEGIFCCAILDSIGSAPTVRRNVDAEVASVAGNALGVSEFARAAATHSSIYNCLTIGINQLRVVVGARIPGLTDTPGGRAWRHACVMRVELVRGGETETIKLPGEEKPVPIGYNIYARVKKNQVGAEGRAAMYWFIHTPTEEFDFGIDYLDEIARLGIKTQVFKGSGWYHHPAFPADAKGEHKLNGINKIKELVRADPAIRARLTAEIIAAIPAHGAVVAPMTDNEQPIEMISSLLLDGPGPLHE